jgi:hypothetical protein
VLDLLGIVFSGVMMLYVVIQAVQLDASRPWFETATPDHAPEATAGRRQRRATRPVHPRGPRH